MKNEIVMIFALLTTIVTMTGIAAANPGMIAVPGTFSVNLNENVLSMSAYPHHVWSSFVNFVSFSTSLMASSLITSMGVVITSEQYQASYFGNDKINAGNIFSITLIILLVYLEVTRPIKKGTFPVIKRLRVRFSRLTTILLIIFAGMVFTKVTQLVM